MKTDRKLREAPSRSHASAETLRLNPHLFGALQQLPTERLAAECTPKPKQGKPRDAKVKLNATEQRMCDWLEARQRRGEIRKVRAMAIKLRFSFDVNGHYQTYTPDFVVDENDGSTTLIETKGAHIYPKDVTRFKSARADWPIFNFEMWQWENRTWTRILPITPTP